MDSVRPVDVGEVDDLNCLDDCGDVPDFVGVVLLGFLFYMHHA